jgi:hypothetical protein
MATGFSTQIEEDSRIEGDSIEVVSSVEVNAATVVLEQPQVRVCKNGRHRTDWVTHLKYSTLTVSYTVYTF